MWIHRMILDAELEQSRCPDVIVTSVVNEMRGHFAPVEELHTRVFRYQGGFGATCIQVSLPGTCSPVEPKAESI